MSKTQITDILILGMISGVVALLTSVLGVSGTIIGSVLSSIIAEVMKRYLKDPVTDKLEEYEKQQEQQEKMYTFQETPYKTINTQDAIKNKHTYQNTPVIKPENSKITTKLLFIFPLVVILIIEIIHFLGKVGFIPIDIFYSLESVTNWQLLKTIGYALIVMGFYPLVSENLKSKDGILLIIVGIIELIFGYADVNSSASFLYSMFSSLKDYVNIAIILTILYTILTIPSEEPEKYNTTTASYEPNTHIPKQPRKEYKPESKLQQQFKNNNNKFKNSYNKQPQQRRRKKQNTTRKQDSIDYYMDDEDEYF